MSRNHERSGSAPIPARTLRHADTVRRAASGAPAPTRRGVRLGMAAVLVCCMVGQVGAAEDLSALSLEQILDATVYSASKLQQRASDAPASVTVITAEEIRQYGWRTLSEVLRSVRSFYVQSDRLEEFLGVRGLARPGDYNTRVLLLVDGYSLNDNVYDEALTSTAFPLDLDLVDRIEIVRGPGSALYGANALFAVINVITRSAANLAPGEVTVRAGGHDTRSATVSAAKQFEQGAQLLVSLSHGWSRGEDSYYPDLDTAQTNFGRASGTDFLRYSRFFGKLSAGPWTLAGGVSRRFKGNPAAVFGVDFNDPDNRQVDYVEFVGTTYEAELSATQRLSLRLSQASYDYGGIYVYSNADTGERSRNDDSGRGSHWNAEIRLLSALSPAQSLVTGIDYQKNYRGDQVSYMDSPDNRVVEERHTSRRLGIFVQDQYQWNDRLALSAGIRYDKITNSGSNWSPRLGLIYRPTDRTVWKLLGGSAFRAPNLYELYYAFPDTQLANPTLRNETIRTVEAAVEHYLGPRTRVLGSVYQNRIRNLITQAVDADTGLLRFENAAPIKATGVEAEIEQQWEGGGRLRLSIAAQRTKDADGRDLTSSPRHMAKLNASVPLPWSLRAGVEAQWTSRRKAELGETTNGVGILNLTLLRSGEKDGIDFSFSVYNVLDKQYADPAGFDPALPTRDRVSQEGRTWRSALTYHF